MLIKCFKNIKKIESAWNSIFVGSSDMTYYQSYDWNKNVCKYYKRNYYMALNYRIEFSVLYRNNQPIIIAPLTIPKKDNDNLYVQILGQYTKSGLLNFIYTDDVKCEEFDCLIEFIKEKYKKYIIRFYEIPNFCKLNRFLSDSQKCKKISDRICIRSVIPDTVEEYYNGLSKSIRQTIRTSYNRLNKDGVEHKLIINQGQGISNRYNNKLLYLYKKRYSEWDGKNNAENRVNLIETIRNFLAGKDPFLLFAKNTHSYIVSYLIDDNLAAYFIALADDKGYFIVPTLVHNSDYKKYSPGLLIIFEFISKILKESDICIFDLSRGNEEYKTRYLPFSEKYINEDFYIEK